MSYALRTAASFYAHLNSPYTSFNRMMLALKTIAPLSHNESERCIQASIQHVCAKLASVRTFPAPAPAAAAPPVTASAITDRIRCMRTRAYKQRVCCSAQRKSIQHSASSSMILRTSSTVDASLTAHTAAPLTLHMLTLYVDRHTAAAPHH
eukprot:19631-Heterococcus_DN1.PRE.2